MPHRYIQIPEPMTFVDRETKQPMKDARSGKPWEPLTFKAFVFNVFENPKWMESAKNARAQRAIERALDAAYEKGDKVLMLTQEDWQLLKDCVETPRIMVNGPMGPQQQQGWGFLSGLSSQLVDMIDAVTEAKDTAPVEPKKPSVDGQSEAPVASA